MWPVLSASAAGGSPGTPSSGAGGEDRTSGHSLPHSCGCLWSQGLHPRQMERLPHFLFANEQAKNYGVLGTGLEQHT